ncbi:hypothetical protein [Streptomyces sp. NPDC052494]|uniref:hypothetical protein n=1 Tax=Streptomyces sp. NPDC052494 TaxID=3365692 RepID=UPI0037CEF3AF
MRIKHALATALGVGALTLLTAPVADARVAAPEAPAGGAHCKWDGPNGNWAGCRDKISDIWNNGFPGQGEDVKLFRLTSWNGSWVCLHQGHSIPDLGASGLTFFGPGIGQGEPVNDKVGSHLWVDAC